MYFTPLTWHFYCWQTKVGRKNMFLFIFWALKKLHHPNIHISPYKYLCMPWIFAAFWHLKIPVHVGICGIQTQPHKCWHFPFSHRDSIVIRMAMWNISGPHTGGVDSRIWQQYAVKWRERPITTSAQLSHSPTTHPFITVKILRITRRWTCEHPAPALLIVTAKSEPVLCEDYYAWMSKWTDTQGTNLIEELLLKQGQTDACALCRTMTTQQMGLCEEGQAQGSVGAGGGSLS